MIKRALKSFDIKKHWFWLVLIGVYLCFYFTTVYGDILATYYYSLSFLDCVSSGNITDFYSEALADTTYQVGGAVYDIPVYILFGIWLLPCWIFTRFWGVDYLSVGCLLWLKLIVVIPLILIIPLIKKILKAMDINDTSFGIFFFLSSLMVVYPAMGVVQYDTPSLFLTLMGLWMYSREEKISWKTLLIFSIAILLKSFALFTFIIVVLMKEKRVLYIIRNLVLSLIPLLVSKLLFINDAGYHASVDTFNDGMLSRLTSSALSGGLTTIPLFLLVFFMSCVIAYFIGSKDQRDFLEKSIWLNALLYWGFFSFVFANPYWIILFSPFIIIAALKYKDMLYFNFWVELVMEVAIIALQGVVFWWVYWGDFTFSKLLLKGSAPKSLFGINSLYDIAYKYDLSKYYPVVFTLFTVTGSALILLNNPWIHKKLPWSDTVNIEKTKKMIMFIRLLAVICLFAFEVAIVYIL